MQSRLEYVVDALAPHYQTRNEVRDSIIAQKGEDAWFKNPEPKGDYAALRKDLEQEEFELDKAIKTLEQLKSIKRDHHLEETVARTFFNEYKSLLRGISEVRVLGRVFNDWQQRSDQPRQMFFRVLYQLSDRGSLRVCKVIDNTSLEWAEDGRVFPPRGGVVDVGADAGGSGSRGGSARGGGVSRGGSARGRGVSRGGGGAGGGMDSGRRDGANGGGDRGGSSSTSSISRQPPPVPTILLVDSISTCRHAVSVISNYSLVSVDLEGVQLCRSGEICILQVAVPNNRVYLFDICALRADAFEAGGLRDILTGPSPLKLMFDCRADADALFHQYHVQLDGVYDVQVAVVKAKMNLARKLPGLAVCISRCCGDGSSEAERFKSGKQEGAGALRLSFLVLCSRKTSIVMSFSDLFSPERGGSFEVWRQRPLTTSLLNYCAQDVTMLFACHEKLKHHPNGAESIVSAIARQRIQRAIVDASPSRGAHKVDRDFE
jgi:exonuclease 3'-5' domain-containing protein 1